MLGLNLTTDMILVGAGALGALTIEHGWGWVLARYHAYVATAQAKAKDTYGEITSQVDAATKGILSDVNQLKADVAALKAKVGA